MNFEIEMMSSEMVTPSSPTPSHLKTHKLSFLDQIMPHLLIPSYFFYPPPPAANNDDIEDNNLINNAEKRSRHLKKSLSQALTLFYPLAGRLVIVGSNGHVNCNDEGVAYDEARAHCKLYDVINNPNILAEEEDLILSKLLPYDDARDVVMVIQVTLFRCGGLALGLGFSHRVADGLSVVMFLKCWATFSRGGGSAVIASPKFECAAVFPPEDDVVIPVSRIEKKENVVTKKFMFSSQKINHLKEKYGLGRSTRIETLSAFIGNRFMIATTSTAATTSKVLRTLRIYVDIRPRVVPPLSEHHFGNIVIPAIIPYDSSEKEDKDGANNIGILIKKMKDAIRNVNGDSVAKLRQQQEQQRNKDNYNEEEAVTLGFTIFCNFPIQEIDFGWGKPMFVAGPNMAVNNMVFYCNSLCGGGNIDAWVNLKEEDMIKFQADSELLQHVSCAHDSRM